MPAVLINMTLSTNTTTSSGYTPPSVHLAPIALTSLSNMTSNVSKDSRDANDYDLKGQQQSVSIVASPTDTRIIQEYDKGHDKYTGRGTREDPFIVDWDDHDPENPFNWTKGRRWLITIQVGPVTTS